MFKNQYGRHVKSIKYFCMKTNKKQLQYITIKKEKQNLEKKFPKNSLITNNLVEPLIAY